MYENNFLKLTALLLCPPGHGVYTVNTAKERKEELEQALFPESLDIEKSWLNSLESLDNQNLPCLLGICSDTGGGILRGANWGPLFLRLKLLENLRPSCDFLDLGDVRIIPHLLHDKYLNDETLKSCRQALYKDKNSPHAVSPLSITEEFLNTFYIRYPQKTIFALGGDHSVSYPLVKSYLKSKRESKKKVALIHFDAHTDLLHERLGIDICFASWVTHILNDLEDPSHCFQIGIRSSGKNKQYWENKFGLTQFWSTDIFNEGPFAIAKKITKKLKEDKIEEIYISFDIDALDSQYASATGTPEPNGLGPHHAAIIIGELLANFHLSGADMVEVAPFLKTSEEDITGSETTLNSAALISTLLIEGLHKYGNI